MERSDSSNVSLKSIWHALVLLMATWGLAGSILYIFHSEVMERTVERQGMLVAQWQGVAQAKHDTLQAYKDFVARATADTTQKTPAE